MANLNFAAQVDEWTKMVDRRMTAVFRESTERVKDDMQTPVGAGGNMPIATGFLRNSLMASTASMPPMTRANPGGSFSGGDAAVSLVIAGAEIGDTIYLGYTANYGGHVNYGANGRPPRQFVGLAAQKWPAIVDAVVAEAKARVK